MHIRVKFLILTLIYFVFYKPVSYAFTTLFNKSLVCTNRVNKSRCYGASVKWTFCKHSRCFGLARKDATEFYGSILPFLMPWSCPTIGRRRSNQINFCSSNHFIEFKKLIKNSIRYLRNRVFRTTQVSLKTTLRACLPRLAFYETTTLLLPP